MKKTIRLLTLLGSVLLAQNERLVNGVYAVERDKTTARHPVIRQLRGKDVVLDSASFVPLSIQGKPEVNRGPRGSWLAVQLTPEAARRLEELTRSHLNRPIAVVVGDKILSAPTVRSVIADGKARLTPCEDDSCETLLGELTR